VYKIDTANTVPAKPPPAALGAEAFFKDRTSISADGTLLDADFLNMLQGSLIAVLDDQGIAHSKTVATRFLDAIDALVDERIALSQVNQRSLISGLYIIPTAGGSTFTVDDGTARDFANSNFMRNSAGLKTKDCSIAWNTGTGAMASSNTWADPYFGRVFAIGKATGFDINYGVDQSATAANLLSDAAGDGFTTYRQIGWAVRVGAGLLEFKQSKEWPVLWKLPEPRTPVNNTAIAATTSATFDLDVPAETLHYGTHTVFTDGGVSTEFYGQIGIGASPALPTSSLYNYAHSRFTNDWRSESPTIFSILTAGAATLQGRLTSRFSSTSGTPAYYVSTQGFLWDRRNT